MVETRTPRSISMDPSHITEFASKRYLEKLRQHNANQTHTEIGELSTAVASCAVSSTTSSFLSPLRESKTIDSATKPAEQKRDKRRFFRIKQRVLRQPKTASSLHATSVTDATSSSTSIPALDPTTCAIPFDELLFTLPNELLVQIFSSLSLADILSLRLTSKSWHTLITLNEGPIVRHYVRHHIPAYALRLYPITHSSDFNFHALCGIWHRLHVAAKLAFLISEWLTKDVFLQRTEHQRISFAPQHETVRRRLIPLLFTLFHFFETYRKLHLERITRNDGYGLQRDPFTLNPIEKQIMDTYDDQTLLHVHEVFPLVLSSFCRRLRPPTYVGLVERSLRGYLREKPAEEVHTAILCLGGLRQMERLWKIKGYNSRRAAVDDWYASLTKEVIAEPQIKARLGGFRSLRRKKSTSSDHRGHRSSTHNASNCAKSLPESPTTLDSTSSDSDWIFHTTLAAGAPMPPLDTEQADKLLNDLPALRQIWSTTAEALIFERRIVSHTRFIKRNQSVILDLIRPDGLREENEWWYGIHNPDAFRPPPSAGATEDDAD